MSDERIKYMIEDLHQAATKARSVGARLAGLGNPTEKEVNAGVKKLTIAIRRLERDIVTLDGKRKSRTG